MLTEKNFKIDRVRGYTDRSKERVRPMRQEGRNLTLELEPFAFVPIVLIAVVGGASIDLKKAPAFRAHK